MMRSRLPKSHAPAARLGLDGDGSAGDLTAADREASQSPKAKRIASGRDGRGSGCAAIHASRLSSSADCSRTRAGTSIPVFLVDREI